MWLSSLADSLAQCEGAPNQGGCDCLFSRLRYRHTWTSGGPARHGLRTA